MRYSMLALLLAVGADVAYAQKLVFAHYIIGNTDPYNQTTWENDVALAASAGIDGFSLDIGGDSWTQKQLGYAYAAAESHRSFMLFISFDYGAYAFSADEVIPLINRYSSSPAQYNYTTDRPMASTFEGPSSASDWADIKAETNAFFVPDYSSLGYAAAAATPNVDGLLSWIAWPTGAAHLETENDTAYMSALGSKPYMMPVSPWFYTNLPNKNWLWRGDNLWHYRWRQVAMLQPALVEILTWNDWGESHYIAPNPPFESAEPAGASTYVDPVTHSAWLSDLPYYICMYKTGAPPATFTQHLTFWYRLSPGDACSADGTTCNTSTQDQSEIADPTECDIDAIFFTIFTTGTATVKVSIGDASVLSITAPSAGVFHSSVPFGRNTGAVVISASIDDGSSIGAVTGPDITTDCVDGNVNWNPWVGGGT